MIILPNMGLAKWDNINDNFSHEQLAANFQALDDHDHTAGKGKQIPYGGLAEQSVGKENLREGVYDTTYVAYTHVHEGAGIYSAGASGTKIFSNNKLLISPFIENEFFYLNAADYAATGFTPKLRIRAQCVTSATAPAVTLTVGLYPASSIAAETVTFGSVIAGSTVAFATPAKETLTQANSGDFSVPASGIYGVGVANSGSATGQAAMFYQMQLHYV